MAHSKHHAMSVSKMSQAQLLAVIASGSLLAAAAKHELARRTGK